MQTSKYLARIVLNKITNNAFFSICLLAAAVTSLFNVPQWNYIDGKVLICLFQLMLIVKALEEYGVLSYFAIKISNYCPTERRLTLALCSIAFLLSMFTTNDVAVLTIIPILTLIAQSSGIPATLPCILITIAANLGSTATPIGNPQNLYLFSFYKMNPMSFFSASLPLCGASLLLTMALILFVRPRKIQTGLEVVPVTEKKKVSAFLLLSIPVIASIVGLIPYALSLVIVMPVAFFLRVSLLHKLDYKLLLTFVFLFIAVGNITHMPALKMEIATFVTSPLKTYVSALLLSQVISNVPSAVMLAPFTAYKHAIFYGVNIGGLGTPVASLASIISFSLFQRSFPGKKYQFAFIFLLCNFILLFVLSIAFAVTLN